MRITGKKALKKRVEPGKPVEIERKPKREQMKGKRAAPERIQRPERVRNQERKLLKEKIQKKGKKPPKEKEKPPQTAKVSEEKKAPQTVRVPEGAKVLTGEEKALTGEVWTAEVCTCNTSVSTDRRILLWRRK
ncbi:MAG: hypothetical protein HFG86_12960 [Dorea sp.]|nr:hypothetical protein [Dorea sp.]